MTVRYADRPVAARVAEPRVPAASSTRTLGCLDVTQFVGLIPPGRAPLHSHTYDEVVYVDRRRGRPPPRRARTRRSRPGSCIHLPPLQEHCLENTGPTPMRVLGVFHPSGEPGVEGVRS